MSSLGSIINICHSDKGEVHQTIEPVITVRSYVSIFKTLTFHDRITGHGLVDYSCVTVAYINYGTLTFHDRDN